MNCLSILEAEYSELGELGFLQSAVRDVFPRFIYVLKKDAASNYWLEENNRIAILNRIGSRPETNCRALLVLCWGSFEEFLRRYLREVADLWNGKGLFERPPDSSIWSQHALVCAKVLGDAVSGHSYQRVDLNQIARDLQVGICAESAWRLNGEALSIIGGKLEKDQLEKYGKRVGVDLAWRKIGEGERIKEISGKAGPSEAGEWAMKRFCEIRDRRNEFAHQGVGQGGCSWEEVESAMAFLKDLAKRLTERAVEDLS